MSRRLIYRTKTSGLKLAAMLEDQSQLQPETIRGVRLEAKRIAVLGARTRAKAIQPTGQGRTPSMDIMGEPLAGYVEAV